MMKESLDEEVQKSMAAKSEKMSAERKIEGMAKAIEAARDKLNRAMDDIALKDSHIKIHLRKIGELERVRRVLQHQLHEARGQIEPMDKELDAMRSRLAELDGEYDKGMRAAANLELEALGGKKEDEKSCRCDAKTRA